ncbi:hypothetical protein D3C87_1892940 [compost metagenome]
MAAIATSVTAPNTQRQKTTLVTGWPDISTNQPIVPDISMAAVISALPLLMSAPMVIAP